MTLLQANRNLIINHMDGFSGVSESRVLEWTEARFPGQNEWIFFPWQNYQTHAKQVLVNALYLDVSISKWTIKLRI